MRYCRCGLSDPPGAADCAFPGRRQQRRGCAPRCQPARRPLGTAIVDKLKNEIQASLQSTKLQEQFAREGASAVEMTSADFGGYIETEIRKWGEVVEESKIRPQ
jgi:hypothetical protein